MNNLKEEKLSPWFPPETKPVLPGVYETVMTDYDGDFNKGFSYWDGKSWWNTYKTINQARRDTLKQEGAFQHKRWRGVKPEHLKYQVVYGVEGGVVWDAAKEASLLHAQNANQQGNSLNTFWKE